MLIVLRLLLFAILALVVWKAVELYLAYARKTKKHELKCVTCRHCELVDRDGVMCRYGDSVTLKTLAHVSNCMDYAPEEKRSKRR